MAKKKRTLEEWFPSFESWELSSLEIVGIFKDRLSPHDFETYEIYVNTLTFFEQLHRLKNGHELSTQEVKLVREVCNKILYKDTWTDLTKDERRDESWGSKRFYNRLQNMQTRRFLKCIPHTVGYLPIRLGVQREKKLAMPLDEYPLNRSLVDGICTVYVEKMMHEDKDLPFDYIKKHRVVFEGPPPANFESITTEGKCIIEILAFYMSVQVEKMKKYSKEITQIYAASQLGQLRDIFMED